MSSKSSSSFTADEYLAALATIADKSSLVPAPIRDLSVDRIAKYLVTIRMWEDSHGELSEGHWPEGADKTLEVELRRMLRVGIVEVADADHDIHDGRYRLTKLGRSILADIEKAAGVDASPPYPGAL